MANCVRVSWSTEMALEWPIEESLQHCCPCEPVVPVDNAACWACTSVRKQIPNNGPGQSTKGAATWITERPKWLVEALMSACPLQYIPRYS